MGSLEQTLVHLVLDDHGTGDDRVLVALAPGMPARRPSCFTPMRRLYCVSKLAPTGVYPISGLWLNVVAAKERVGWSPRLCSSNER